MSKDDKTEMLLYILNAIGLKLKSFSNDNRQIWQLICLKSKVTPYVHFLDSTNRFGLHKIEFQSIYDVEKSLFNHIAYFCDPHNIATGWWDNPFLGCKNLEDAIIKIDLLGKENLMPSYLNNKC